MNPFWGPIVYSMENRETLQRDPLDYNRKTCDWTPPPPPPHTHTHSLMKRSGSALGFNIDVIGLSGGDTVMLNKPKQR